MKKKIKEYEEHEDLIKFEKVYKERIKEFLNGNPESRIVFLNADFGWGKTTFIKNNLKVKESCIYSPWLNKADNYLEEIYYNVTKKDKGKLSSITLIISVITAVISIMSGSIISILIEVNKDNFFTCSLKNFNLVCTNNDTLPSLLLSIIILIVLLFIISIVLFLKPIPIINFFKKDNGKYYENRLIKKILANVDNVLIVEDIDRIDDIEKILVELNKISEYIIKDKQDKYILITGDFIRTVRRIDEPTMYDNSNYYLPFYRNKGTFLVEKVIGLRIDFLSLKDRMDNIFKEKELYLKLAKIEYDEIITFIKNKFLSIRFFVKFLDEYNDQIREGYSIYHLLLKYYQEEKYFNISKDAIHNSLYNIEKFPICLNDIELFLQLRKVKLPNCEYKKINKIENIKSDSDVITNVFADLIAKKDDTTNIFNSFYNSDSYPVIDIDKPDSNGRIQIGSNPKLNNLKNNIDNYLIGFNNNRYDEESVLINKRCYFNSTSSRENYELYKIKTVDYVKTKLVSIDEFTTAYIACFLRDNRNEINTNYPGISKIIKDSMNRY